MTKFEFENSLERPEVDTPTSRLIRATVETGMTSHKPIAIVGNSGIGKSYTMCRLAIENPDFFMVTASPINRRIGAILSSVASAVGLHAGSHGRAEDVNKKLVKELYGCAGVLIIVDEAQFLDMEAMRVLLDLWENAGVNIAFVGNPGVLKRTKVQDWDLDAIVGRFENKLLLTHVLPDDIQAFGVHYNIAFEAHPDLQKFGASHDLRQLCGLLDRAHIFAGSSGQIGLQHLREAMAIVHGEDEGRGLFKLSPRSKREENAA